MKKRILYIGNYLQGNKTNKSYMHTLGYLLEDSGHIVYYSSKKTNKILRLFDMFFSVLKKRKKVDIIFIDTYSTTNFYYALIISKIARFLKKQYIPILHGGNLPFRLKKYPRFSKEQNSPQNV